MAPAPDPCDIEVVAHRGSSEDVPEHTLAAYRKAIDDGADTLEADVRLTQDGHLVCVHDRRIDRTSSGRGLVSTLELADLAELDFGSWKARSAEGYLDEEPDHDRRRVLTLERLVRLVLEAGRPVSLAVETKHPTRYAGLVERRLVALLDRYGLAHPRLGEQLPVRVMSFSPLSLRRMRQLAPSVGRVLLLPRIPLRYRDGSLPDSVAVAGVAMDALRALPSYVERVHARGNRVHAWVVNDLEDVDRCADAGVDAIITDRPAAVLRRLGRPGGHTGTSRSGDTSSPR